MFNYIHADINVNYTRTAKYGYIFSQLIYIVCLSLSCMLLLLCNAMGSCFCLNEMHTTFK